ncbi:Protease 2 [Hordeum vulgare]|nr:Protease 2 [Hordeum vulgare]
MAKNVGFKDGDELYYTIPSCSLDEGIDLIHDDNSVVKMLNFAKKHNFAYIYLKHKGHESMSANPRSGLGTNEKLPAESRERAGPLYMKPMVNFDKLCEVYATDLAKGGSAKGPGEEEIIEDGSTVDAQPTSKPPKENLPKSNEDTSPSGGSRHGRKRTYPDDDALESSLRAFMHESQVHEQTSANRTKLLDIPQNLEGL